MAANAEETAAQAERRVGRRRAGEQERATVATGAEEMGASIREIAKNANEAARVATSAVKVAEKTNATVAKLGESQRRDRQRDQGHHLDRPADQPAGPERDDRGGPGRARRARASPSSPTRSRSWPSRRPRRPRTSAARSRRSRRDTKGAVEAIGQIGKIINQINDIQNTIASAVEEQTATTGEISRNVAEAAKGSSEIAQNITGVAQAATSTTEGIASTRTAAEELARMAAELQNVVGQAGAGDKQAAPADPARPAAAGMTSLHIRPHRGATERTGSSLTPDTDRARTPGRARSYEYKFHQSYHGEPRLVSAPASSEVNGRH